MLTSLPEPKMVSYHLEENRHVSRARNALDQEYWLAFGSYEPKTKEEMVPSLDIKLADSEDRRIADMLAALSHYTYIKNKKRRVDVDFHCGFLPLESLVID